MRKKSLWAAACIAAAVLTMAGCGKDNGADLQSGQKADGTQVQNQEADTEEADDGTAAQGTDAEEAETSALPDSEDGAQPEEDVDIFEGIATAENGAGVSIHDPSIKVFDGKYYLYGSHMTGAHSEDMQTWTYIGNTYSAGNPLFENLFEEGLGVFDYAGTYEDGSHSVWAEDVIYIEEMQKCVMYFCTSSTYIKSKLCYATSDRPEGPYAYQGTLLYLGFTNSDIEETDVYDYVDTEYAAKTYFAGGQYNNMQWPNCIDPAPFYDKKGRLWMTYGSWSGGIFLLELDPETGLVIHPQADEENQVDPYFGKRLIGGGHNSIEGPYIQYDETSGYYYLYVSYGGLERTGGYQIRVFRSETPDGEYVDMNGEAPRMGYAHVKYGLKLSGNYYMPSCRYAYMATGGQSAFRDADGKQYLCYHSRFDHGTEYHEPCVKQVFLNREGWPMLAPYTTKGETISEEGYSLEEMAGTYYFINQDIKLNSDIVSAELMTLEEDGTVSGCAEGTWQWEDGTCYMSLTYEDVTYSGVFCAMKDEAGTDVMTFSAVGDNKSVWGAKYE